MTIKITPPVPPHAKAKKSFLGKLFGASTGKEHMTSRRIRVSTTNPADVRTTVKSTKTYPSVSKISDISKPTSSDSAKKLRKKLGLHKTPKSTRDLYDSLEKEANSSSEDEVSQYEKEQQEYHDHDKIVNVEEHYEDLKVSLDYDELNKKSTKKKNEKIISKAKKSSIEAKIKSDLKSKQEICVQVPGEGTFKSSNDENEFIHLHDPKSYDWASEEGFVDEKK